MTAQIHTIGCIFDHGCRNVEELDRDTIEYAVGFGFEPEWADDFKPDQFEYWSEVADEAIDYLNSLDLPPYTYYGNEAGAFGLWPNVEELEHWY
jgi:hypothetical protein